MLYRNDKYGNEISQLGYGCMRFTRKGAAIDYKKGETEILRAVDGGINYFDTAYIYPGSEKTLGKIVASNNLRDKIYIATKLPHYMMKSADQIEKTFKEQLSRLQTDHIDYYLMHMFTDYIEWEKLQKYDICKWIESHKKNGSIGQIGFSYHGNTEGFLKILNAYDWDFCQIQYNYLDEHSQAGRAGLQAAQDKGIPVIIMEPLRGGKLIKLPSKCLKMLKDNTPSYKPAELGLRWLWNQPGVTCVLSGMNSVQMIEENIDVASKANVGCMSKDDEKLISDIVEEIRSKEKVGCTGCGYCQPCPKGIDIPRYFYYYNLMGIEGKFSGRAGFAQNFGLNKHPVFANACVECGKCEKHCPQSLEIRCKLKEAERALRPAPYKIATWFLRKFWH